MGDWNVLRVECTPKSQEVKSVLLPQELRQQARSAIAAQGAAEADLARVKRKGADIQRKASPCHQQHPQITAWILGPLCNGASVFRRLQSGKCVNDG